jgi:AcrR family transcriptional regulator
MASLSSSPSLQEARKTFVRNHICEAARDLFFRQGYAATTFEQIAKAAGTQRTTLYSHFADKAEILRAIAEDYHIGLCRIVETLPGPIPTRPEIEAWIDRLVDYVIEQRTPATLVIGLGVALDSPPVVDEVADHFRAALARRIPAFAHAFASGDARAAAWATIVLRELSIGCLEAARLPDARATLSVVAELFERFTHETHP